MNGLIKDGFPLVGLIHICMTEPLKEEEKGTIKYDFTPFDLDNSHNNDFLSNTVEIKVDHFSWFSAENQMKRLISKDLPKYVGLNTFGLNITKDNEVVTWFNHDFNKKFEAGYFSPYTKGTTIDSIKAYFEMNRLDFKAVER